MKSFFYKVYFLLIFFSLISCKPSKSERIEIKRKEIKETTSHIGLTKSEIIKKHKDYELFVTDEGVDVISYVKNKNTNQGIFCYLSPKEEGKEQFCFSVMTMYPSSTTDDWIEFFNKENYVKSEDTWKDPENSITFKISTQKDMCCILQYDNKFGENTEKHSDYIIKDDDKYKLPITDFNVLFDKRFLLSNVITLKFKIKNSLSQVIEDASIDIRIYLEYEFDNFILTSFNNSKRINLGEITNLKHISHYSDETERELGSLSNINLEPYLTDDMYSSSEYSSKSEIFISSCQGYGHGKSLRILDSIENKYNNIWFPNETKDLSITYPIKFGKNFYNYKEFNGYFKDSLIVINKDNKPLPNTKLFIAKSVLIDVFLNAKNSLNLNFKSKILSKDITNEWNNKYLNEEIRKLNQKTPN